MTTRRASHSAFFAASALTLAAVIGLNLLFEYHDFNSAVLIRKAAGFQSASHGLVSMPDDLVLAYKIGLLELDAPSVKGAFFGSSTLLGLRPSYFPNSDRSMNMAVNRNIMLSSIGEATLALGTNPELRVVTIALDWGLSFPFKTELFDPSMPHEHPAFTSIWNDLLSASRTERSASTALWLAFGEYSPFLTIGSVYTCADGEVALGLDARHKSCSGYRYDGSSTFFGPNKLDEFQPIAADVAQTLLSEEGFRDSLYSKVIANTKAEIPESNYKILGDLNAALAARGGQLILLLPPMLPGLTRVALRDRAAGPLLEDFKTKIKDWAAIHAVDIVDLNQSEDYGCTATEFGDGHHAMSECWQKIGSRISLERPELFMMHGSK
jgi:hypothetical protein